MVQYHVYGYDGEDKFGPHRFGIRSYYKSKDQAIKVAKNIANNIDSYDVPADTTIIVKEEVYDDRGFCKSSNEVWGSLLGSMEESKMKESIEVKGQDLIKDGKVIGSVYSDWVEKGDFGAIVDPAYKKDFDEIYKAVEDHFIGKDPDFGPFIEWDEDIPDDKSSGDSVEDFVRDMAQSDMSNSDLQCCVEVFAMDNGLDEDELLDRIRSLQRQLSESKLKEANTFQVIPVSVSCTDEEIDSIEDDIAEGYLWFELTFKYLPSGKVWSEKWVGDAKGDVTGYRHQHPYWDDYGGSPGYTDWNTINWYECDNYEFEDLTSDIDTEADDYVQDHPSEIQKLAYSMINSCPLQVDEDVKFNEKKIYHNLRGLKESTITGKKKLQEFNLRCPNASELKKALIRFNSNGKSAKQGHWAVGKGGYDQNFVVYYKGEPVVECTDGDLEYTGSVLKLYAKSILELIGSVYPDCNPIYEDWMISG